MKLLSFQPYSLYENGGGSRILRRLYKGRESQIHSLAIQSYLTVPKTGLIKEKTVLAKPLQKSWMRWRLRDGATWLRENVFRSQTINKVRQEATALQYDVLHVVNHGPFSTALCDFNVVKRHSLWVSFHDHFSTVDSSLEDTQTLWEQANRRLVISSELGHEYQRLFGKKEFELITDGVAEGELSPVREVTNSTIIIYFAGLLHINYLPLFSVLADALDLLVNQGTLVKLVLRGTQQVNILNNRLFETEYRSFSLNDIELKHELDSSSILYLPIKFVEPDFYTYSLSTKMVGYLGSSGAILYHGPSDSAAFHLLQQANAAVCCTSLDANELSKNILTAFSRRKEISVQAKELAKSQFDLNNIQKQFWHIS